jgi:hypothetical protein
LDQESPSVPEQTPVVDVTDDLNFNTETFPEPKDREAAFANDQVIAIDDPADEVAAADNGRLASLTPVESFLDSERWEEMDQMSQGAEDEAVAPEEPEERTLASTEDEEVPALISAAGELPDTAEPDILAQLDRAVAKADEFSLEAEVAQDDLDAPDDREEAAAGALVDDPTPAFPAAFDGAEEQAVEEAAADIAAADDDAGVEGAAELHEAVAEVEEALESVEEVLEVEDEPLADEPAAADEVATQFDEEADSPDEAAVADDEAVIEQMVAAEAAAVVNEGEDSEVLSDEDLQAQVAIWELALQNKSEAIKREARRRLKELTGNEYD